MRSRKKNTNATSAAQPSPTDHRVLRNVNSWHGTGIPCLYLLRELWFPVLGLFVVVAVMIPRWPLYPITRYSTASLLWPALGFALLSMIDGIFKRSIARRIEWGGIWGWFEPKYTEEHSRGRIAFEKIMLGCLAIGLAVRAIVLETFPG